MGPILSVGWLRVEPIIRSAAIVTEGRSLNYESTDTLVTLSARRGSAEFRAGRVCQQLALLIRLKTPL